MATLGEAYVSVRADLKPFEKDLQGGLKKTVTAFEKTLNKELGQRFGRQISEGAKESLSKGAEEISKEVTKSVSKSVNDGFRDGANRSGRHFKKDGSPFTEVASALASALDDGISALPKEAKAAIVAALLAITPFVIQSLGGAIGAAVIVGFTGLGSILSFQFEEVSQRGSAFVQDLRDRLVRTAEPFAAVMIDTFDFLDRELDILSPKLFRIFDKSADFVRPLTTSTAVFLENILDGVDYLVERGDPLVDALGDVIQMLGAGLGDFFVTLGDNAEELAQALRVLGFILLTFIKSISLAIDAFSDLQRASNWIVDKIPFFSSSFKNFNRVLDNGRGSTAKWSSENQKAADSLEFTLSATEAQTKAIEEQEKALKDLQRQLSENTRQQYAYIDAQIAMEQSLDDLDKALEANGNSLDIHEQAGRDNARAFERAMQDIQAALQARVIKGEITADKAQEQFAREIDGLRKVARQAGITEKDFNDLFNAAIEAASIEISPNLSGLKALAKWAGITADRLAYLVAEARALNKAGVHVAIPGTAIGGATAFAAGGVIDRPTLAMMGEAGSEAVLPLDQPQRSAQILANTPLAGLLGGGGTTVNVFLGTEPLEQRMYQVVEANNQVQASRLSSGPRMF